MHHFRPLTILKRQSFVLPIKLLAKRDRILLIMVLFTTIFLAFLDLFGVLLIGVIGSLSLTGLGSGQIGNRVSRVLRFFGMDDLNLETQVIVFGLFAAASLIIKTLLTLILVRKTLSFMARRGASISAALLVKYFSISVSQLNHRSAQTSIYALTGGVDRLMVGVIGVSVALIADITLLIVMGAGLFIVDPITAISTSLIFGLLTYFLYKSMHQKMRELGEQQGILGIESSQRIYEAISSYRELLVRDRRGFYAQQIGNIRFKLAEGNATIGFMSNLTKYVIEVALVFSALLLAFYHFSTSTSFRAFATVTIFIAASTRIIPAILRIQQGILGMKVSLAQAKPTMSLIQELSGIVAVEPAIKSLSRAHQGFNPRVSASNLYFSYKDSREVLKDVSFQVNPGEFVAIVGGSGAGKTTLLDVIIGALEPDKGNVFIAGMVPRLTYSKWPGAVSYVPQGSPVVNGTIRENLGLGYPAHEIIDQYCWESLKTARLEDFVRSLPQQLDTPVGDRGTRLSGGQRQRLGIARALITQPKLLILDEATSSLDGVTESEISDALRGLRDEITLIVIAHRLSTVVGADKIYFMEDGTVKGVGTFEELKANYPDFLTQAELLGL
jgi:ABC-type multidrug transport system fused ATPase/permease subunit